MVSDEIEARVMAWIESDDDPMFPRDAVLEASEWIESAAGGEPDDDKTIRQRVLELLDEITDGTGVRLLNVDARTRVEVAAARKRRLQGQHGVERCELCGGVVRSSIDVHRIPADGIYDDDGVWMHYRCAKETET